MRLALVTGGLGLTGRALVDALLGADWQVRVLDLGSHPDPRVDSRIGDVTDPVAARAACVGVDTIFHTVAIVSQHPAHVPKMEAVNVGGTAVMLAAGKAEKVPRFVFTSSIDVVFSGAAISAGEETLPYASRYLDDYGRTKAEAERLVRSADGDGGMNTVSLRAAGIFGPHDRNRFPVILHHVRTQGFIAMGDGRARFSHVYVDNVAHAHVLAAEALRPGAPLCGNAYFLTDHEPTNFFDFIEPYLSALGIRRARVALPGPVAWAAAYVVEGVYALFSRWITTGPVITRYTVAATCRDFWFTHSAATRDFGYTPIVTAPEAYARTLAWLRQTEDTSAAHPPSGRGHSP